MKGIPEIMFCRIFVFMWSFGALVCFFLGGVSFPSRHGSSGFWVAGFVSWASVVRLVLARTSAA